MQLIFPCLTLIGENLIKAFKLLNSNRYFDEMNIKNLNLEGHI